MGNGTDVSFKPFWLKKITCRSSALPKPVTPTFSGRFFASASTSFQVFSGLFAATKNADGCWITTPAGTISESFHLVAGSICSASVSAMNTEIE
ncbi:hypothetical protein D3C83_23990 [compost metagenome]